MKKIIVSICLAVMLSAGASAQVKEWSADDSRITFVGRTEVKDGSVSFDYSGVYARISFEGRYLAMKVSDTHKNYYNVWIDKTTDNEPDKIVTTFGTDSLVVLADESMIAKSKKPSVHNVTIQKRTEGEQGMTTISSFFTSGELLQAEGMRSRVIECVGDSYTCGYGTENSVANDPFKPETENCNKAYGPILARYFDADYVLVAHSGMGIARNYNDSKRFYGWYMPEHYTQLYDMNREVKYDASSMAQKPGITIVYLGTNDFSVSKQPSIKAYVDNYITLIKSIKANWGEDHPILCVAPKHDYQMIEYVHQAVEKCGMKNVEQVSFFPAVYKEDDSELGAGSHPNYIGQQKKAMNLIPYICTLTGWELNNGKLIK